MPLLVIGERRHWKRGRAPWPYFVWWGNL